MAEPKGELGTIDPETWYQHNSYAEWYWNSIRFEDNPARRHHREVYGDAPYDDFLDTWKADEFDPDDWCALFARTGARYVVPTTKHHDGIALWDAPGTASRNTVHRGPRRDLIREIEQSARAAGMRFGVYYSGGFDWHVADHLPVIADRANRKRPNNPAYAAYAYLHVRDLIDRDCPTFCGTTSSGPTAASTTIRWDSPSCPATTTRPCPTAWSTTAGAPPTATMPPASTSTGSTPRARRPENCRGIGLSFGYNQIEDSRHLLSGPEVVRHLVDIVLPRREPAAERRPTASGLIPDGQRRTLEALAD